MSAKLMNYLSRGISLILWDWSGTIVTQEGTLCTDALPWLRYFRKLSIPQGIVSNERKSSYLLNSIKKMHLLEFFEEGEYVICAGSDQSPKPSTDMFHSLLAKFPNITDPTDVLYIGDSETDRQFAANCGCYFCHAENLNEKP